jgi:hypothetical protein
MEHQIMKEPIIYEITNYVKAQSRNKIVFHSQDISDIVPVNLGLRISETIYSFSKSEKISLMVKAELEKILNAAYSQHSLFGRYLSIDNVGILFEPKLRMDFSKLLDSYSQNNVLFVEWKGDIDSENLYFLTKENGIKINIKNLSHIAI